MVEEEIDPTGDLFQVTRTVTPFATPINFNVSHTLSSTRLPPLCIQILLFHVQEIWRFDVQKVLDKI
jgi:hypothetical protein